MSDFRVFGGSDLIFCMQAELLKPSLVPRKRMLPQLAAGRATFLWAFRFVLFTKLSYGDSTKCHKLSPGARLCSEGQALAKTFFLPTALPLAWAWGWADGKQPSVARSHCLGSLALDRAAPRRSSPACEECGLAGLQGGRGCPGQKLVV